MVTERDIQKYIWANKNNFVDMLEDVKFPPKIHKEKPWEYTPAELIYNKLIEKYEKMWEALQYLSFFGYEVPLKKEKDSTIRADFLGVFEGRNGIAVIELKKSNQTERQAFTGLLAYGSHVRTIFAPMSKVDIAYILISPMEERIIREATVQNIVYDQNEVFVLIPKWDGDDVSTLKLKPWIPELVGINNLTQSCFSESNFDVFKVVWDGLPGEWSPERKGENPNEDMAKRLNTVSAFAAQILEARGIHGFVFSSQTWSELREMIPLTNSIVIVGINPYKSTKNRFLTEKCCCSNKEANEVDIDNINMLDIIPELSKLAKDENEKTNFLSDLSLTWPNEIAEIGFQIVTLLTKSLKREFTTKDYGNFDWRSYQKNIIEDANCHDFDIRTTGLFRELFFKYSELDYDYVRVNGYDKHPTYYDGNIPDYLIDTTTSHWHVRNFLLRLFNPYHESELDDEVFEET